MGGLTLVALLLGLTLVIWPPTIRNTKPKPKEEDAEYKELKEISENKIDIHTEQTDDKSDPDKKLLKQN